MSHRRRKLTLTPRPGGFGEFPAPDDPRLPRLVAFDCDSGRPRWWLQGPPPGIAAMKLRARHSAATDVGLRRQRNDDVVYVSPSRDLYLVCDGVGGRPYGNIAAREAAEAIHARVARDRSAAEWTEDAVVRASRLVNDAIQCAARAVYGRAVDDPGLAGMCTSASLVLVRDNFAVIGQVGDSRVYLAREDRLIQLTEDHTLRTLMIKRGIAGPETAQQRSSITRAIGRQPTVAADVMALPLAPGDRLLLCTDGLHHTLSDDDLLALFELDVADAALAAIRRANDLGGPDNVSALFVELAA